MSVPTTLSETLGINNFVKASGVAIPTGENKFTTLDKFLKKIQNVVLWENSDPTQNFNAQTVTLSEPIENFKYYTIIYALATDGIHICFSNTAKSGDGQRTTFVAGNVLNWRNLSSIKNKQCIFESNQELKTYGGTTVDANQRCIPLVIIGHN